MAERDLTAPDWRGYAQDEFPEGSWGWDHDILRASSTGPRIDVVTRERFRDFALSFDWRLPRGGNSGVLYRVSEDTEQSWQSGPEMQLLDDEHHADGAHGISTCGALYGLLPPWIDQRNIANTYHSARLIVRGTRVEHWIDDRQVLGYDLANPDLTERITRSKFKDFPNFSRQPDGHIVLQHHGTEAWFRRLRIETF